MTPKQWHRFIIDSVSKAIATTTDADSCFVECGVKQGSSSVIMAKNLERKGFLFDTWTGPPHFSEIDAPSDSRKKRLKKRMNTSSTKKDCIKNLKDNGVLDQCVLVQGDICKTVPTFVANESFRVCMLHIDTDVHSPAKTALECFFPKMVDKGVIFFHDYGDKHWPGIKILVDGFAKKSKANLYIFNPDHLRAAIVTIGLNADIDKIVKDI
jgi:O-methyltransferase